MLTSLLRRISNTLIRRLLDGPRIVQEDDLPDEIKRDIGLLDGRATLRSQPRGQDRTSRWPTTQDAAPASIAEKRCDSQESRMPCTDGSSPRAAA